MQPAMDQLKFVALDGEDLEVVSAHLQDAVVKPSEILWRPAERRLVIALARFDWQAAQSDNPEYRRRRAALRFERVEACRARDIAPSDPEAVLNLLAVDFVASDAPGGIVTLTFSGGAALRLQVECLEAELVDLGPTWACAKCPSHADQASQETA